jgi:hypothetical protein
MDTYPSTLSKRKMLAKKTILKFAFTQTLCQNKTINAHAIYCFFKMLIIVRVEVKNRIFH